MGHTYNTELWYYIASRVTSALWMWFRVIEYFYVRVVDITNYQSIKRVHHNNGTKEIHHRTFHRDDDSRRRGGGDAEYSNVHVALVFWN